MPSVPYTFLHEKWNTRRTHHQKKLQEKHPEVLHEIIQSAKQVALGTAGSMMLLLTPVPVNHLQSDPSPSPFRQIAHEIDPQVFLMNDLFHELPDVVVPLSPFQEAAILQTLSRHFHLRVASSMSGIRLERNYGLIGQEQHLARFPGDTLSTHFDTEKEATEYASTGMAPGLGAYGYFASSAQEITKKDSDREKYYIAVQTFLSPGYNEDPATYNAFFKFKKMLVVNPQNGKAVIADIGDAGPGESTGKHAGGSPEVMAYLERHDGAQKGPVLYFFVDDPSDTIPLGPIHPIE